MKTILLVLLAAASSSVLAELPNAITQLGAIAKNADGTVQMMNQADAIRYCETQGQHLPTAKEYAQFAISLGAAGFSDSANEGHNAYDVRNADGSLDNFNFAFAGYNNTPTGEMAVLSFWTSSTSVAPLDLNSGIQFSGHYGFLYNASGSDLGSVLCAQ